MSIREINPQYEAPPKRGVAMYSSGALKRGLHLPHDAIITGVEWDSSWETIEITFRSESDGLEEHEVVDMSVVMKFGSRGNLTGITTLKDMVEYRK